MFQLQSESKLRKKNYIFLILDAKMRFPTKIIQKN